MSDLFDTRNVGYVIKIIRGDKSSKSKITVLEVSFPKGQLPKMGNALTIFYIRTPGRTNEVPVFFEGVLLGTNEPFVVELFDITTEVPIVLEVYKILNKNTVRAVVRTPRESLIELIKDLPLGIAVIDSEKSVSDYDVEFFKKLAEERKAIYDTFIPKKKTLTEVQTSVESLFFFLFLFFVLYLLSL